MIFTILNTNRKKFWILFHAVLGVSCVFTPIALIIYFYVIVFSSIRIFLQKNHRHSYFGHFVVYCGGFELISRMAYTSPFIPYELSKYLFLFFFPIGILMEASKGRYGVLMLFCLLPSLFFDLSGIVSGKDLIFNVLGSINICLCVWYFSEKHYSEREFFGFLQLMGYTCICVLSYIIFKTPNYNDIDFVLGGNFQTTGGFGPNQVSTILGLGSLISFLLLRYQKYLSGNRLLDQLIFVTFFFVALLSFSRGGIFGAAVGILIVVLFEKRRKKVRNPPEIGRVRGKRSLIKNTLFIAIVLLFIVILVNSLTDGALLLRYQGETAGTINGSKVKSLSTMTSGRYDLFFDDLDLFEKNWLIGVGAGASKYMRESFNGVVTHVELGRLLAEHGVFGVLFVVLCVLLAFKILYDRNGVFQQVLFSLFVLGVYTSFHAATRTFVTPLLMGLSTINVYKNEIVVFRK